MQLLRGTTCKIKLACFAFWDPRTSLLAHCCCEESSCIDHPDVPSQIAFSDWGLCSRQAFSDCPAWSHVAEEAMFHPSQSAAEHPAVEYSTTEVPLSLRRRNTWITQVILPPVARCAASVTLTATAGACTDTITSAALTTATNNGTTSPGGTLTLDVIVSGAVPVAGSYSLATGQSYPITLFATNAAGARLGFLSAVNSNPPNSVTAGSLLYTKVASLCHGGPLK